MILEATSSVTSSPVSADGATPYDWLELPTIQPCGPAPARANLAARQAKALGLLTSGTYGLRSTTSSNNAALTSFLVNRLRARMGLYGGILYRLTWKDRSTPAQRLIPALRASRQ